MIYDIPEVGILELDTIVLDLNGTLTVKGKTLPKTKKKIQALKDLGFQIYLLSGDQRGTGEQFSKELGIQFHKASSSQEKAEFTSNIISKGIVAVGNARIDIGMFQIAKLAITTLQGEGIHTDVIKYSDIIIPSIINAFDLLIDSNIMKATMRK